MLDGVREAGVGGAFLRPGGLVTDVLEDVGVCLVAVDLAGVAAVARVDDVVVGAIDSLLGLADMPSFFSSLAGALASTDPDEMRLEWIVVPAVVAAVLGVFRTPDTLGRAAGLFNDVVADVLAADVEVGWVRRGATGIVWGLLGGTLPSV